MKILYFTCRKIFKTITICYQLLENCKSIYKARILYFEYWKSCDNIKCPALEKKLLVCHWQPSGDWHLTLTITNKGFEISRWLWTCWWLHFWRKGLIIIGFKLELFSYVEFKDKLKGMTCFGFLSNVKKVFSCRHKFVLEIYIVWCKDLFRNWYKPGDFGLSQCQPIVCTSGSNDRTV